MTLAQIQDALPHALTATDLPLGQKYTGKVRDCYTRGDELFVVTTDRQSAFDRAFPAVPFKGQVLTAVTGWWFDQTADVCPHHVLDQPDPQVLRCRRLEMAPVEMVVRDYLTGSTDTSVWPRYERGEREMYGLRLPDGLCKNAKLPETILTPTTKAATGEHDAPIAPAEIVKRGLLTQAAWDELADVSLRLFSRGRELAAARGLILVDTKFEFGWDSEGQLRVADEILTPDSSRYWQADSYAARHAAGQEPVSLDKEFLRLWVRQQCDPYTEAIPAIPDQILAEFSQRYQQLAEAVTGQAFTPAEPDMPALERIRRNLTNYFQ